MKYLHENNILHRDLKTENILMDDFLCPKIADFGLSKKIHYDPKSMSFNSSKNMKGTFAFMAPEARETHEYTQYNDIYAFGFIIYEIIANVTNGNASYFRLVVSLTAGKKPELENNIPVSYRCLIERCWSQNASDRPKFSEIISLLKNDKGFITEKVDENEFHNYVKYIEEFQSSFRTQKIVKIEDFVNSGSKKFREIDLRRYLEEPKKSFLTSVKSLFGLYHEKLFPRDVYLKLSEECQRLVVDAEDDPEKQFYIGTYLIEEKNGFPLNVNIGVKYFERSIAGGNIESALYLSKMLFEGRIVQQDIIKAKKYLYAHLKSDQRTFLLYGKILKKEKNRKEARKYFQKGSENGDVESMYFYAQMLFTGENGEKNVEEARNLFNSSKDKGFFKSEQYIKCLDKMSNEQSFADLPSDIQHFFIKKILKYNKAINNKEEMITRIEIKIENTETERLFKCKLFESPYFLNTLRSFEHVIIEIQYPSKLFDKIYEKVSKMKQEVKVIIISVEICGQKTISSDFARYKSINIVRIDSATQKIDEEAFFKCSSLTQITIPSSVTEVGYSAFSGCSSLTQVIIPSSVTFIEEGAFSGCSSLAEITLSSSLISIDNNSFEGCSSLAQIKFPSSVTEIGNSAFKGCSSLKKITIHSSVKSIGDNAFRGCSSLEQIKIHSSITEIGKSVFRGCSSLTQIKIPSSVISIGNDAFNGCSSLEQITIPSSVTSIGNNVFKGIKSLVINGNLQKIEDDMFNKCSSLKQITIPSSVTYIGVKAFNECSALTHITLPPSVTKIGYSAFRGCSSLTQISILSSISEIENTTFEGCSSLKQIEIPSSVTCIGNAAFRGCASLENILIPSSVTSIGYFAFRGCSSLAEISIPSSVTYIGEKAFIECSSLKKITMASTLKEIGKNAFPLSTEIVKV
ncbi:hypothetical protein M9Y10_000658 [Tritrichomonas musculus]|uniref:Protein kinase domain-containing protein n=1 Tax=Tritrichomonas musculus TaxID=1915356 RepID=A0ABR2L4U7_9EUKA